MSTAYYNEIDPYAAQWLRNLIAAGHIADGVVDERSIEDVLPSDLDGFTQCHFFAGIGVWSLALRRAGWADDRPVWTGSCPCQPFSAAGKGAGFADERHLWPAWHHLIKECKPAVVFGEQVASKDAEPWLDLVQDDLEGMGYPFGEIPFPSAGVGAPHIRDRLYFVADAKWNDCGREAAAANHGQTQANGPSDWAGRRGRTPGVLADTHGGHAGAERQQRSGQQRQQPQDGGAMQWMADPDFARLCGEQGLRLRGADLHDADGRSPVGGFWADADWIPCRDGKWRPVEPGTFPLAHGAPARVGRLRAYGNAINAEAARVFIESVMVATHA